MDSKNQICMTCLLPCESALCIFTSVEVPSLQNTKYPLVDALRIFTDLPVSPCLPEHICKICLDEIQETYCFKLIYDTSLTEQPTDSATKNMDDFHSEHNHHADPIIELIKTEKDNEEYEILNEEQIKQEDSFYEFSEHATLKEEELFVQEVKQEPEIDITDSLNETNPNEKCLRNNLQCTVCTKIFQSEQILKIHMSVHSDFFPYECKICAKSFRYKFELNTHTKTEHEIFRCTTCSKLFNSKAQLNHHIMCFHIKKRILKPFRCDFCVAEFAYTRNLKRHLLTAHDDGTTKFQCELCEDVFRDEVNWKKHIRTKHATQKRNFKCTTCSKLFQFQSRLNRHMIVHSNVRFQCDTCPNEYSNKYNLEAHVRTRHNEKLQAIGAIAAQLQKVYAIQTERS